VARTVGTLATVGLGIAAACSSSKSTGPSAAALATTFDSLVRSDSVASSNRQAFDLLGLIAVDEGATSTPATVTTDGGELSMDMVGLVLYDTASGAVSDSSVYIIGWTSDYSTALVTVLQGVVGPDLIPRHRVGVSAGRLAGIRALTSRASTGDRVIAQSGSLSAAATVFQGTATANADTASLTVSEAAGTGNCVFENEPLREGNAITASSGCSSATVTEAFAVHFPSTPGIAATLTHMSLTSSKTVPAVRVAITG
jgi:hypothetical protein